MQQKSRRQPSGFYPCEHSDADDRSLPDGHAVESCAYCETTFDESNLSAHTFGEDKKCVVCGWQGIQVTYSSGNFEGGMAAVLPRAADSSISTPTAARSLVRSRRFSIAVSATLPSAKRCAHRCFMR